MGNLHQRASRWLDFLSGKGLSGVVDDKTRTLPKQAGSGGLTSADSGVRLPNGQIVWLRDDALRGDLDQEYRGIEVFDETPQTDKAIIAAVTALETRRVEDERLEKAILLYKLGVEMPSEATPDSEAPENLKPTAHWLGGWAERIDEAARSDPELQEARSSDSLNAMRYMYTFGYIEELLRYFRPDYDKLSRREQTALIQGACDRLNKFHWALEELVGFAEYATYDASKRKLRKLKPATDNVQLYVDAALLRDVEGLKYKEIGDRLGARTPDAEEWKTKRDASTPRSWVAKGRGLLELAWGEEGYAARVAAKKAERERWRNLSIEDRLLEATAEQIALRMDASVKEVLQIIELGEPDESKDGAAYIYKAFNRGVEELPE